MAKRISTTKIKKNIVETGFSSDGSSISIYMTEVHLETLSSKLKLYKCFHIITERGARGDLNLDDAYDELFRLLECLLHPIRSLEQL